LKKSCDFADVEMLENVEFGEQKQRDEASSRKTINFSSKILTPMNFYQLFGFEMSHLLYSSLSGTIISIA
jgi:hypothetical protein